MDMKTERIFIDCSVLRSVINRRWNTEVLSDKMYIRPVHSVVYQLYSNRTQHLVGVDL